VCSPGFDLVPDGRQLADGHRVCVRQCNTRPCVRTLRPQICALCLFAASLSLPQPTRRYIKNTPPRSLGQTPRAAQIMGSLCLFSGWRDARSQIIIHRAPTYVTRAQKEAAGIMRADGEIQTRVCGRFEIRLRSWIHAPVTRINLMKLLYIMILMFILDIF
jgi:hypothetical protein